MFVCLLEPIVSGTHVHHYMPWQVCNHPDLFEGRAIVSAFDMQPLVRRVPSAVLSARSPSPWGGVSPALLDLASPPSGAMHVWEAHEVQVCSPITLVPSPESRALYS